MQCGERNAGGHCQGNGRLLLCMPFQLMFVVVEEDCQYESMNPPNVDFRASTFSWLGTRH